ncbi:SUMF1/EgtB/PvdO family nonheme iron enzyme [candidate division KSB1 bacterium]|nr:SUMF1/EgtB/PvdO family nonheme iron enzyme [candidate division KSB1 bacterium]
MNGKIQLILLLFFVFVISCQNLPPEPDYTNPLDEKNPATQGDPFKLTATIANGGVTLTWVQLDMKEVEGYFIYRSLNSTNNFIKIDTTQTSVNTWTDKTIENGSTYWYKVTAFGNGQESSQSNPVPVRINTLPLIQINGNSEYTPKRLVELTILAGSAQRVWVSHDQEFSVGAWEDFSPTKSWQLQAGPGTKIVYAKVMYQDGTVSAIIADEINVLPIQPNFSLASGNNKTSSRKIKCIFAANGENLAFKMSEDSSFVDKEWQAFQDTVQFTLSTGSNPKTVYAKIKNDFEVETPALSVTVFPIPISNVLFQPEDNISFTKNRNVILQIQADGAKLIQVAEDTLFTDIEWQPYQEMIQFQLSPLEGSKNLFLRLISDFEMKAGPFQASVVLDQSPPMVKMEVFPALGVRDETEFYVQLSKTSDRFCPAEKLKSRIDWENDGQYDTDWSFKKEYYHKYSISGRKNLKVVVEDEAGNAAEAFQEIFVNSRPVARFLASPKSGDVGLTVAFNAASASDPDGHQIQFRWDFQSDGTWDTEWLVQSQVSFQFLNGGNFKVTLQVKDEYDLTAEFFDYITINYPEIMVLVPAGEFTMGNAFGTGDSDEQPAHTVYLNDFFIDKYEVTNGEYAQFLTAGNAQHFQTGMKIKRLEDGRYVPTEKYENHPVVYVTYENALAYARWRGKSLPTEAQWEKAAAGTQQAIYPWGSLLENTYFNFWLSGDPFESAGIDAILTTPVGMYNGEKWNGYQTKYGASVFGAFDMAGNVREWCQDWYQADYYTLSSETNPSGPTSGKFRVTRGGSWADDPYHSRTASRSHHLPLEPSPYIGFRCVK